jgi:hypothetical protein
MNVLEDVEVACPFCGGVFALQIETTLGSHEVIEDCAVCCHPVTWQIECAPGEVHAVTPLR